MKEHVRPSELARFWKLHPRTVAGWIRDGKLTAVRTPGNHFRVRAADVRAFCAREGRAAPPFVEAQPTRAVVVGAQLSLRRALRRAAGPELAVELAEDDLCAIFAAVLAPPSLLVVPATLRDADAIGVVRALRATPPTKDLEIVAYDAATAARRAALLRAGAARVIARGPDADVAREILRGFTSKGAP